MQKNLSLRLWHMSEAEFERNLRPYVSAWKEQNQNVLFSIVVLNMPQKEVAEKFGLSPATVNDILKRGYKNFLDAQSIGKETKKRTATEKK